MMLCPNGLIGIPKYTQTTSGHINHSQSNGIWKEKPHQVIWQGSIYPSFINKLGCSKETYWGFTTASLSFTFKTTWMSSVTSSIEDSLYLPKRESQYLKILSYSQLYFSGSFPDRPIKFLTIVIP